MHAEPEPCGSRDTGASEDDDVLERSGGHHTSDTLNSYLCYLCIL